MDIYFASVDRTQVYKLPVIPPDMPELSKSSKNEEFASADGNTYTILGGVGLVSFDIDCFLPPENVNRGYEIKSNINPYLLINLWSLSMTNKTPIKCVQTRNDGSEILNWLVTVESMSWYPRSNGDIKYKATFKQYINPLQQEISQAGNELNSIMDNLSKVSL